MKTILTFLFTAVLILHTAVAQQGQQGAAFYDMSFTVAIDYSKQPEQYAHLIPEMKRLDSVATVYQRIVVFNDSSAVSSLYKTKQLPQSELYGFPFATMNAFFPIGARSSKNIEVYYNYWWQKLKIEIDPSQAWKIDYSKTKVIDGRTCFFARYTGVNLFPSSESSEGVSAYFDPSVNLPIGPGAYGGLPGIIVQLDVNIYRYTLSKIDFDSSYDFIEIPQGYKNMSPEEFEKIYEQLQKRGKQYFMNNGEY